MILSTAAMQCRALSRIGFVAASSSRSSRGIGGIGGGGASAALSSFASSSLPACTADDVARAARNDAAARRTCCPRRRRNQQHHQQQQQQQQHQSNRLYYSASTPTSASIAQLVKQLRQSTGAPMMECKKALTSPDVDGDIEKAREWLRKHGSAKASSKVAGREALEGLVGMRIIEEEGEGGRKLVASLVKVASETDFASRSEAFSGFVQEVADAAASDAREVEDIPSFLSSAKGSDGKTLSEGLADAILAIRENLQVDSVSLLDASSSSPGSVLAGYVHGRASPASTCGTAASVVELGPVANEDGREAAREAAKKLAMHVVAARPQYLNIESVPEDVVGKEKEILMEKMANSGKPPEILEKIVTGQLRKFYEGICLTEQAHMVEEGNPKVSKVLKGIGLEVKAFRLMGMNKSS